MAKFNKADAVVGGRCQIPKDRYRARIINEKVGKSRSDYDMITLTGEIIAPEEIDLNGKVARIAGRQFQLFLMLVPGESWGLDQVCTFMDKLAIDYGGEVDTGLTKEYFHGVEFDIVLDSEEDIQRKPAQPGQKEGDPILDGEGNPITNGWRIIANLNAVPEKCAPSRSEL